ncbi:MAG: S49 family peptidase [Xanthobacteraceae bacterium]
MSYVFPHIAERVFGRAHPIEPEAFRAIIDGPLTQRIMSGSNADAGKKSVKASSALRKQRRERLHAVAAGEWQNCSGDVGEYFLTDSGVAIVPVCGVLGQRFDWLAALCGWTTYEGLSATFDAIDNDYRVKAVLLDVESPGGEAAGMLDIADRIIASRKQRPVWAVANAYALSAAYAIAGSAERLIVPRLCTVGSIGAVAIHLDQSGYDKQAGLKYTAIFSGARKIDGWGHAPLSDDARVSMQERIDYCREQFASLVGRQGRMTHSDALATDAAIYHDRPAVQAKLADAVGSFDEALAELSEKAAPRPRSAVTAAVASAVNHEGAISMAENAKPGQDLATDTSASAAPEKIAADSTKPAAADPIKSGPSAASDASADAYGMSEVAAVLDLCASQGVTAAAAREYVAAKSPLSAVRASIAADKAKAADASRIDATKPPDAPAASSWDKVIARLPGFRAK